MKIIIPICIAISCMLTPWTEIAKESTSNQELVNSPNEELVENAILDYVEGIYEVDPSRIERSVSTELRKRGYWYNEDKKAYGGSLDMTYEELYDLAATWNKEGDRADKDTVKEISIFEVNDMTASAKLTATWGIDYFHLAKVNGKWMIMNVLWQSDPR